MHSKDIYDAVHLLNGRLPRLVQVNLQMARMSNASYKQITKMDNTSVLELNLNNVCRVCLSESDDMKDLLSDNTKEPSLLDMFNKISTFKVIFNLLCIIFSYKCIF